MNVQEEDRQKNRGPGRSFGIAAATAIGVGVGAAIYYYFSKQSENPHGEGSSSEWSAEQRDNFRQRSWSLEECSICFDIMLKDQSVTSLPCTHNFHSECIKRWLEDHDSCPNCRLSAAQC